VLAGLGVSRSLWVRLVERAVASYGLQPVWKDYGAKHGWQLKLMRGRRVALYLIPKDGTFVAALALDGAAVEALPLHRIPARVVDEIRAAAPAPEGHPARIRVETERDADLAWRLVGIKLGR
jgi:hypothetical protein